jgi:hypothetical protein
MTQDEMQAMALEKVTKNRKLTLELEYPDYCRLGGIRLMYNGQWNIHLYITSEVINWRWANASAMHADLQTACDLAVTACQDRLVQMEAEEARAQIVREEYRKKEAERLERIKKENERTVDEIYDMLFKA